MTINLIERMSGPGFWEVFSVVNNIDFFEDYLLFLEGIHGVKRIRIRRCTYRIGMDVVRLRNVSIYQGINNGTLQPCR